MKSLFYKDFALNKGAFAALTVCYAFIIVINLMSGENDDIASMLMFQSFMLAFATQFLGTTFIQNDELQKWESKSRAFPIKRLNLIAEKYILAFIVLIVSGAVHGLSAYLFTHDKNIVIAIIYIFIVFMLIQAVEMPFMYKFGVQLGSSIKFISILAIILAFLGFTLFAKNIGETVLNIFQSLSRFSTEKDLTAVIGAVLGIILLSFGITNLIMRKPK